MKYRIEYTFPCEVVGELVVTASSESDAKARADIAKIEWDYDAVHHWGPGRTEVRFWRITELGE